MSVKNLSSQVNMNVVLELTTFLIFLMNTWIGRSALFLTVSKRAGFFRLRMISPCFTINLPGAFSSGRSENLSKSGTADQIDNQYGNFLLDVSQLESGDLELFISKVLYVQA